MSIIIKALEKEQKLIEKQIKELHSKIFDDRLSPLLEKQSSFIKRFSNSQDIKYKLKMSNSIKLNQKLINKEIEIQNKYNKYKYTEKLCRLKINLQELKNKIFLEKKKK